MWERRRKVHALAGESEFDLRLFGGQNGRAHVVAVVVELKNRLLPVWACVWVCVCVCVCVSE